MIDSWEQYLDVENGHSRWKPVGRSKMTPAFRIEYDHVIRQIVAETVGRTRRYVQVSTRKYRARKGRKG